MVGSPRWTLPFTAHGSLLLLEHTYIPGMDLLSLFVVVLSVLVFFSLAECFIHSMASLIILSSTRGHDFLIEENAMCD